MNSVAYRQIQPIRSICALIVFLCLPAELCFFESRAQEVRPAPGGPGLPSLPINALAEAQLTSITFDSKIWLTLRGGMLGEAAWPRLENNNSRSLMFAVTDGKTYAVAEDDPSIIRRLTLTNPRSLSFQQINVHPTRRFTLSKKYTIAQDTSVMLMEVEFSGQPDQQLYVVYDPMMAGTDQNDTASVYGGQGAFVMYEKYFAAALIADVGFDEMSVGFQGRSDGWSDLKRRFRLTPQFTRAENGNVVCVARLNHSKPQNPFRFTIALAFSDQPETALLDAEHALEKGFAEIQKQYDKGWNDWLTSNPRTASPDEAQLNMAAMLLRAREVKLGRSHIKHSNTKQ